MNASNERTPHGPQTLRFPGPVVPGVPIAGSAPKRRAADRILARASFVVKPPTIQGEALPTYSNVSTCLGIAHDGFT
jgi:hypothetical protein